MYDQTQYESPLGPIVLAADGAALIGLWFLGQKHFQEKLTGRLRDNAENPIFTRAAAWLDAYFSGARPQASALCLRPQGTEFQKLIWSLLLEIPYGQTVTYGALAAKAARRMGRRTMSAQAAAGAVARNPISILIPCHRVIGADGSLTGYAAGLEKKRWLLKHEGFYE